MIEQHYYTWEQGGLFSQTNGYDTIAKSPGLKVDFIKNYLHPIGSHDGSNALQKHGEEDRNRCFPSFMIMPVATGELVIGQAVYKNKDLTRFYPTFFVHHYILSANEKYRYVKEPEKLFGITKFETEYNTNSGVELPTLAAIPYENDFLLFKDRARLLREIKMDESLFEKLLAAVFTSIHSNRKIVIILDVPIVEMNAYAKALLYHVYMSLPWSIAVELGVSIYSVGNQGDRSSHITFLDKSAASYHEELTTEFVLDFVNREFFNLDEMRPTGAYFKVAAAYKTIRPLWEKFNSYGQQLLTAMKDNGEKTLSFYNRVATLFALYTHSSTGKIYILESEEEREGFLVQVFNYLNLPISDEFKRELISLMEYAIKGFEIDLKNGVLLSYEEIDVIIKLEAHINRGNKEALEDLACLLLEIIEVASRENKESYINQVLDQVSKEISIYPKLFEKLYDLNEVKEEVAYTYIKKSFEKIDTIEAFMRIVGAFEPIEEILFKDVYYTNLVKTRLMDCLQATSDKVMLLEEVQSWCSQHQGQLYEELVTLTEEHFLKHIRLEAIATEEALCGILFKHTYEDDNYEVIKQYQKLKTSLEAMSPKYIKVNPMVQKQIKYFYEKEVKKEDFYMLVYAFLESNNQEDIKEQWRLNLTEVLAYLYTINVSIMLEFIVWSKGQEVYMNKAEFDETVISFFLKLKETEGQWPKELTRQKLEGELKTKDLYSKLNKAMQPTLIKLLRQYRKGIIRGLIVLGLCAGIGIGSYFVYQHYTGEVTGESTSKGVE